MLASNQVDELICMLASWDRQTLISQFLSFESNFPVDLTPKYLASMSDDRLRHVFLAVCLQNQRLPEAALVAA